MKKTENTLAEVILSIIVIIALSPLLTLYSIKVIQDIVLWYDVPVAISKKQMFGAISIIGMLKVSTKSDKTDKGVWETAFTLVLETLFLTTLLWGAAYLYHFFF